LFVQIADGVINEGFKYHNPVNYSMCHIVRYEDYYIHSRVCRPETEKVEPVEVKSLAKKRKQ
jgi:hypothetical protein